LKFPSVWTLRLLTALAFIGALAVVCAQQQPPDNPPQQRPTFRAGANLVRVDVTVIDHRGDPVTTLTKDDFEVREDGIEQAVETFKLIEASGEPAPDDDLSLPIRSPEHAAAEAARDEVRVFVIFWDEYHIGQLVPANLGREALTDFVKNAFGPTDLVALMDPLTPLDAIRFTRDRMALADEVHKLKGRYGLYLPPRSPMEEAQLELSRDVEATRAQVTASALEGTVLYLRSIREGRKAILFVSQDVGPIGGRGMSGMGEKYHWLDKIIQMANDSNTAIYTLDPRGLTGGMSDILRSLAGETGGRVFASNAPGASLRQIVKDASAFYLLGYASTQNPADGKFHRIKVRVKRPGVDVKARSGYVAPSLKEIESAHTAVAAVEVPGDIAQALSGLTARPGSAGDLWVGTTRGADGAPRVTVSWTAHDESRPTRISVLASGADGQVYFDGPLANGTASFSAPAGVLKIRRTVLDADGGPGEREDTSVTVPDFNGAVLSLASPVLLRARTGVELKTLHATPDAPPYAGRGFDRTDRLLVRFSVFGRSAADATITANLLSRRGVALSALPFTKAAGQTDAYEIEFPMSSIARGDYVIAIDASHGDEHARALVSFHAN
jgi:VWFA-related protein